MCEVFVWIPTHNHDRTQNFSSLSSCFLVLTILCSLQTNILSLVTKFPTYVYQSLLLAFSWGFLNEQWFLTCRKHFLSNKIEGEFNAKCLCVFCYATKLMTFNEIVEVLTNIELLKAVDFCVIHNCKATQIKLFADNHQV